MHAASEDLDELLHDGLRLAPFSRDRRADLLGQRREGNRAVERDRVHLEALDGVVEARRGDPLGELVVGVHPTTVRREQRAGATVGS